MEECSWYLVIGTGQGMEESYRCCAHRRRYDFCPGMSPRTVHIINGDSFVFQLWHRERINSSHFTFRFKADFIQLVVLVTLMLLSKLFLGKYVYHTESLLHN